MVLNSLFSILFSLMGTGKVRTMTEIAPSQLIRLISDVRVLQWVVNLFLYLFCYTNLFAQIQHIYTFYYSPFLLVESHLFLPITQLIFTFLSLNQASQLYIYLFYTMSSFQYIKNIQMKIVDQKLILKNHKTQPLKTIAKSTTKLRQLNLRSRKVQFLNEQPFESCQNQDLKNQPLPITSNVQTLKNVDQSPQKHKSKSFIPEQPSTTAKKTQFEPIPIESNFPSEDEEQENLQNNLKNISKRKKRYCRLPTLKRILHCEYYKDVTEVDFITYFGILVKKKMFSTLLINEYGQVIFADRLGSEHFQGSLNNFSRNPIYSTILEEELDNFFEKVSWIDPRKRNILKLVIYSKNSKRRYSKKTTDKRLTNNIIFNRYLRCVSCEIKPIRINLSSMDQFEGYWNRSLIEQNKPINCYLMISRLAKELPNLEKFNLQKDRKIQKFLRYTRRKQDERDVMNSEKKSSRRDDQESEKGVSNFQHDRHLFSEMVSHKEFENIMIEMTDHTKHSRSALTRGCVLNSGEGKLLSGLDRV